jgi:hypothetical protein
VLNREFSRSAPNVKVEFTYNEVIDRFALSVQSTGPQVFGMSEDLQRYMGFDLSCSISPDSKAFKTLAQRSFDANRGLHLMYTSTATLQHTRSSATLKHPCCESATFPAITAILSERRSFIRIRREFDTIEIAINNELGKPMPFQFGKSVVVLHFRRRHLLS